MKKFDVFQLTDGTYRAIKYGFSWPALFFTWIWCFFTARLYGWGCVFIGVMFVGKVFDTIESEPVGSDGANIAFGIATIHFFIVVSLGVWFAFNANEFRRSKYTQMGYSLVRKKVDAADGESAISIARKDNKGTEEGGFHRTPTGRKDVRKEHHTPEKYLLPKEGSNASFSSGGNWFPTTLTTTNDEPSSTKTTITPDPKTKAVLPEEANKDLETNLEEGISSSEVDTAIWETLLEFDPRVKAGFDELRGLGREFQVSFAQRVVAASPSDRDVEGIVAAVKSEYQDRYKISDREEINQALMEAVELGPEAEKEFRRVIEIVGSECDLDHLLATIKNKPEDSVKMKGDYSTLYYGFCIKEMQKIHDRNISKFRVINPSGQWEPTSFVSEKSAKRFIDETRRLRRV